MYEKYDITDNPEWNKVLNMLLDDAISEIEVNGPDLWFYKEKGIRKQIEGLSVGTEERYLQGIKNGLVPHVHSTFPFKENSYIFEGPLRYRTEDHFIRGRCHIVLPPAADSPQITIAKKSTALPELTAIAASGSMSTEMMYFLMAAIAGDLTTVISGGTGAGKTTILESLTKLIPENVRIGVAEDSPELYLLQPNVSYLHSVPWQPGMNPNDVATLQWVVAQYQRMRTDKIIIGETRGAEFADFLIAANSGMDGSMTTIHANDPVTCLDKMTNFALKASNSPVRTINTDIANSIDLIVQLIYTADGRYRTSSITEVTNTLGNDESARITTNELYKYNPQNDSFVKAGSMSDTLRKKLETRGIDVRPFLSTPIGAEAASHGDDTPTTLDKSGPKGIPLRPDDSPRRRL